MMNQPTLLMSLKMMESAVTASSLTPTRKMQTMMGRVENTMHDTCTHLRPNRSYICKDVKSNSHSYLDLELGLKC